MHPWVAARPLAVRAASFARRVVSKPGQAPPPPTGAAAWPRRRPPAPRLGPAGLAAASNRSGLVVCVLPAPALPPPSAPVGPGVLMIGSACRLDARPGPAAAHRHRGLALLWSLRHYANPSNDKRPGPQPHKQTLNNVRTRPVLQCLPMRRCAYPRLGLLVWAVHPIRRHYTPSVRVHRHITGAPPHNGCTAT